MLLSSRVHCPLQVLDRQTARNMKSALEASLSLAGIEEVGRSFRHRLFMFCTDEFSSNDLSQWAMQACRSGWLRVSTLCDIHKAATLQGKVFDLTGSCISSVINFALSMSAAGSVGKLQSYLSDIISSRFELKYGTPNLSQEAVDYREQVLNLYLEIPSDFAINTADAVASRQRLRYTQKLRQREILKLFFNGDVRDCEHITHWAPQGQYTDSDHALSVFLQFVVPTLIPHACPIFPRNRWVGADSAIDYLGLLAGLHGLLKPLIDAYCGKTEAAGDNEGEVGEERDCGWDCIADLEKGPHAAGEPVPDGSGGEMPFLEEALVPAEVGGGGVGPEPGSGDKDDAGFDWHTYHKQLKTSVADWVRQVDGPSPAAQLALMRQYMSPVLKMLTAFLYISSKRWSRDQHCKSAKGMPRQYRMLLAHECSEPKKLLATSLDLLGKPPVALPMDDWRQDVSTLCFCMLSRLACGAHQLFIWRLRKYPYALMSSLNGEAAAAEVFNQKRCLQDELTHALCSEFCSETQFCSQDCRDFVQALALLAETDIGAIERQHTIGRKIILSRSMTRPVALRTLSADFLLRQSSQWNTDSFSFLYFDSDSIVKKLKRRQQRNRKPKKAQKPRRGGGGAFRAFLSETTAGRKATKYSWRRAAREYRNLSPEQRAYYKEVGALATQSHKRGFHSFGKRVASGGGKASESGLNMGGASSGRPDSTRFSSSTSNQLVLFDPKRQVKELLSKIHKTGSAVRKQAVESREEDLETMSSFLDRWNSSKQLACVPRLPECRPPSKSGATSYLPKPSSVPWMEWIPPADQFAQANVADV